MTTALILFGLRLAPLYAAIAQVESDNGATSANVYQIEPDFIEDVNRICGLTGRAAYTSKDALDTDKVEMMMFIYWAHYGAQYERKTSRRVTYEVLARIHNGGPNGWRKASTLAYWSKVSAKMKGAGAK